MTIFIIKLFLFLFAVCYVFLLFAGAYLLVVEGFLLHDRDRYYKEEDENFFHKNEKDVNILGHLAEKHTEFR